MVESTAIRQATTPLPRYLPAPFEDVQFKWDASDRYIEIEYIGMPERLIECGAIEPYMTERARKGEPKPRRDSAGHRFWREMKVLRHPLRTALRTTRIIGDPKFAETLPGVPRGLRFKRLDWLDVHPGEVHVTRKQHEDCLTIHTAGTRDNLIAAGFSENYFHSKALTRSGYDYFFDGASWARVRTLMRGYIEIEITRRPSVPDEETEKVPAPSRPPLRLVVDNTAPAVRS